MRPWMPTTGKKRSVAHSPARFGSLQENVLHWAPEQQYPLCKSLITGSERTSRWKWHRCAMICCKQLSWSLTHPCDALTSWVLWCSDSVPELQAGDCRLKSLAGLCCGVVPLGKALYPACALSWPRRNWFPRCGWGQLMWSIKLPVL